MDLLETLEQTALQLEQIILLEILELGQELTLLIDLAHQLLDRQQEVLQTAVQEVAVVDLHHHVVQNQVEEGKTFKIHKPTKPSDGH